ncbi:MAG: hypothetical protein IT538_11830 [Variibacter sp.]|nr:hypothetical protein [Variibacter sp.]
MSPVPPRKPPAPASSGHRKEAGGGYWTTILVLVAILLLLAGVIRLLQGDELSAIAPGLSDGIKHLLVPLVVLINEPAFVYTVSGLIFLSALILVGLYLRASVQPRFAALRRAEFDVRALPRPVAGDWLSACDEIGAVLARRDVLLSTWPSYAQDAADAGRLPARRFTFYVEADPTSEFNRAGGMMGALPSYYTTVGLILTFVGLVVALYFAARGFRSGDMNEARQSIVELLNASAFKFLTSVAALMSAFVISLVHRAAESRVRRQVWRLLAVIDLHLQAARPPAGPSAQDAAALALERKLDDVISQLASIRAALEGARPKARNEAVRA